MNTIETLRASIVAAEESRLLIIRGVVANKFGLREDQVKVEPTKTPFYEAQCIIDGLAFQLMSSDASYILIPVELNFFQLLALKLGLQRPIATKAQLLYYLERRSNG